MPRPRSLIGLDARTREIWSRNQGDWGSEPPERQQSIDERVRSGRLLEGFEGLFRTVPRLDVDGLSDHLLRDLGLADGRAGIPRDRMWD